MPELEEMSREELVVVVRRQAGQLAAQGRQITAQAGQVSELVEVNEALAGRPARLEYLLSRNSGNSSDPPSRDGDRGKPAPPEENRRDPVVGPKRPRGRGAASVGRRGRICGGPRLPMTAQIELHRALCLVRNGDLAQGAGHAQTVITGLPVMHRDRVVADLGLKVFSAIPMAERHRGWAVEYRECLESALPGEGPGTSAPSTPRA